MRLFSYSPHAGFTLLEVLVVLIITTILTSLGSQALTQWQYRQQVKATASDLTHFLNRLRQQANRYHLTISFNASLNDERSIVKATSEPRAGRVEQWGWQPSEPKVALLAMVGEPRFFGKHGTAWPGSFEVGNHVTRWRIIISTYGRVRYCESLDKRCQ